MNTNGDYICFLRNAIFFVGEPEQNNPTLKTSRAIRAHTNKMEQKGDTNRNRGRKQHPSRVPVLCWSLNSAGMCRPCIRLYSLPFS